MYVLHLVKMSRVILFPLVLSLLLRFELYLFGVALLLLLQVSDAVESLQDPFPFIFGQEECCPLLLFGHLLIASLLFLAGSSPLLLFLLFRQVLLNHELAGVSSISPLP